MKKLLLFLTTLLFSGMSSAIVINNGDFTGEVTYKYFFDSLSGTYSAVGQVHSLSDNSMWSESSGDYFYFTIDNITYNPSNNFLYGGNVNFYSWNGSTSVYNPANSANNNYVNVQSNAAQSVVSGVGSTAPFTSAPSGVTGTAFGSFKWFVDTTPPGTNVDTNTILGADLKFDLQPFTSGEGSGKIYGCYGQQACTITGGNGGNGGGVTPPVPVPAPLFLLGSALLGLWPLVRKK